MDKYSGRLNLKLTIIYILLVVLFTVLIFLL